MIHDAVDLHDDVSADVLTATDIAANVTGVTDVPDADHGHFIMDQVSVLLHVFAFLDRKAKTDCDRLSLCKKYWHNLQVFLKISLVVIRFVFFSTEMNFKVDEDNF